MTLRNILLPLFVEVILTFVLLFWMAYLRAMDVRRRGPAFIVGAIVLAIMWGSYILNVQ